MLLCLTAEVIEIKKLNLTSFVCKLEYKKKQREGFMDDLDRQKQTKRMFL